MGIIILLVILALLIPLSWVVVKAVEAWDKKEFPASHTPFHKAVRIGVPTFFAFVLVVVWMGCSFTQIPSKELGVVTSFSRPVSEAGPGLHMIWPWQDVTKINETIFSDTYVLVDSNNDSSIPVRLGDGNTASVNATIRWHVDPAAAEYIYSNYRSNNPAESLKDAVVDTQFKAAVNEVLSQFNPTANVKSALAGGVLNFSPNYGALSASITESMTHRVKDADGTSLVIIDGITVAGINYSQATEDRINSIVAQVAKTQQAVQAENTAKAQAAANDILANSLNQNPYVLVSKCLDLIADKSFTPPAGFSCWPGNGSSVVIPSATK